LAGKGDEWLPNRAVASALALHWLQSARRRYLSGLMHRMSRSTGSKRSEREIHGLESELQRLMGELDEAKQQLRQSRSEG
jgi:hypothetical protein